MQPLAVGAVISFQLGVLFRQNGAPHLVSSPSDLFRSIVPKLEVKQKLFASPAPFRGWWSSWYPSPTLGLLPAARFYGLSTFRQPTPTRRCHAWMTSCLQQRDSFIPFQAVVFLLWLHLWMAPLISALCGCLIRAASIGPSAPRRWSFRRVWTRASLV